MAVLNLIFLELSIWIPAPFSVRAMNVSVSFFGQLTDDLCIVLEHAYSVFEVCLFS